MHGSYDLETGLLCYDPCGLVGVQPVVASVEHGGDGTAAALRRRLHADQRLRDAGGVRRPELFPAGRGLVELLD